MSDEKFLNPLNKYDKFFGGFNVTHYSLDSFSHCLFVTRQKVEHKVIYCYKKE